MIVVAQNEYAEGGGGLVLAVGNLQVDPVVLFRQRLERLVEERVGLGELELVMNVPDSLVQQVIVGERVDSFIYVYRVVFKYLNF